MSVKRIKTADDIRGEIGLRTKDGIDDVTGLNEQELKAYQEAFGMVNEQVATVEKSTFESVSEEMLDIYTRKNADYGNSFDKSLDEDGLLVSKIRLGDKYNRFTQLIKGQQQVSDESIEDTLIDMANYAIMTVMWMRNQDNQMVLDLDTHDILGTVSSNHGADFDGDKCLEVPGIVVGYDLRYELQVGDSVEIIDAMDSNYIGIVTRIYRIAGENPISYELTGVSGYWSRSQVRRVYESSKNK